MCLRISGVWGETMKIVATIFSAALCVASASTSAAAQTQTVPNDLLKAVGPLLITDIEVVANADIIPRTNDDQAFAYVERRMTPEEKAEFTTALDGRPFDRGTAGERLAEYLIEDNLRKRLLPNEGAGRRVVVALRLDQADFPVMRLPLAPPLPVRNAKAGLSFEILDAETRTTLATGRIDDAYGIVLDAGEARTRSGLKYQNFGRDDHLQVLAGVTNAVSRNVEALVSRADLPSGLILGDRMTFGTGIPVTTQESAPPAKITITLATPTS